MRLTTFLRPKGGGGGLEVLQFGTYGPAAPTIAGLTLAWDFDLGYEPLGPMRPEIASRAGSETSAFMFPTSGGIEVVAAGSTRALRFDTAQRTAALIRNGFTAVNSNVFSLVAVARRRSAGADHVIWDVSAGSASGDNVDSLVRYRLRANSANVMAWSRAQGATVSAALSGTPSLIAPNIVVGRHNLASDNIGRGMMNGGTKVSSASTQVISETTWDFMAVGAQTIWRGTGNGSPTWTQWGDWDLYRLVLYAGAATDADLDTLHAWATGAYPA